MVRAGGTSEPPMNTDGHRFCGFRVRDSDWRGLHRSVGRFR